MTSLEQRPSLEDRIRAATRAAASTVADDGAPPLQLRAQQRRASRLPAGSRHIGTGSRSWPGSAWMLRFAAPLAAMAAVVAVIAASVAVADRPHSAASSASGLAGVPRYYLELASAYATGSTASVSAASTEPGSLNSPAATTQPASPPATTEPVSPAATSQPASPPATTEPASPAATEPATTTSPGANGHAATVRVRTTSLLSTVGQRALIKGTLTGAILATIRPPRPFDTFVMATAAADDRTFVLAAQNSSSSGSACGRTGFYSVRFNPADGQAAVTHLPVHLPATTQVAGIALSPDGTRLALELEPGQRCGSGRLVPWGRPGDIKNQATGQADISVYFLPSGTVKTWKSGTLRDGDVQPLQSEMSWATDGTLAFNYSSVQAGVWLLNTNSQGGSLLRDSHYAVTEFGLPGPRRSHGSTTVQPGWSWTGYGILTPDGQTVVAPVDLTVPHARGTIAAFGEFSASTDHPLRFLRRQQVPEGRDVLASPVYSVVWTNSSGSVLVVAAPATRRGKTGAQSAYGVLRGHRFTPIPGAPSPDALAFFADTTIAF
jgi:hypothetical protein